MKSSKSSPIDHRIDLGGLQTALKAARAELRSSAKAQAAAQARYDAAAASAARAQEQLAAASRAVLQGEG